MIGTLAFTWAPNTNKICSYADPNMQFIDLMHYLKDLTLCCSNDSWVTPELNLNGNVHFHGVLQIKDDVKWYKKVLPMFKRNGWVCIKKKPTKEWETYCIKDMETMERVLKKNIPSGSLPLTVVNIKEYFKSLRVKRVTDCGMKMGIRQILQLGPSGNKPNGINASLLDKGLSGPGGQFNKRLAEGGET